jgi:hypothetical protein
VLNILFAEDSLEKLYARLLEFAAFEVLRKSSPGRLVKPFLNVG